MRINPLESQIQAAIIQYLHFKGIRAWVNKTQGTYDPVKKIFRRNTTKKGVSDILGFIKQLGGRGLAIEVKRPGQKPTKDQIDFLREATEDGALAFVAYSVDDVAVVINQALQGGPG